MTIRRWLFYALLLTALVLSLRVAERHTWQVDVTANRINSVSAAAAHALDSLPASLEIDVYVPDLAVQRAEIDRLLAPYRAHHTDTRLRFIDPVARPDLARAAGVDRHGELHLRSGEREEIVGRPSTAAIDAALNRLALSGERWIVALRGHGEAEPDASPNGIGRYVEAVEARGYRVVSLDPRQLERFPDNTALVLVAAPTQAYETHSQALLAAYLDAGGALLLLAADTLPPLGDASSALGLLPGYVVDAAAARYGLDAPDNAIVDTYPDALGSALASHSVIHRARPLHWDGDDGWRLAGTLASSAQSWNETGELRGRIARDPESGERSGPHDVGLLLQRVDGDRPARVAVVTGTGFIANGQLGLGANLGLAVALTNWLSGNDRLAAPEPAPDLELTWSPQTGAALAILSIAILPAAYLAAGLWRRARRRRP